jgi:hypothetical protein
MLRNAVPSEVGVLRKMGGPAVQAAKLAAIEDNVRVGIRLRDTANTADSEGEVADMENLYQEISLAALEPGCRGTVDVAVRMPNTEQENTVSFIMVEQIKENDRSVVGGVAIAALSNHTSSVYH